MKKNRLMIFIISVLICFLTMSSFAKEDVVEFYIMKKDFFKQLLLTKTLKSLSEEEVNLFKISLYHGVSSLNCDLVLKSSAHGYSFHVRKKDKRLSYHFVKYSASPNAKQELEIDGTVDLNEGTYNIKEKWEKDEYVIIFCPLYKPYHQTKKSNKENPE